MVTLIFLPWVIQAISCHAQRKNLKMLQIYVLHEVVKLYEAMFLII